MSRTRIPRLLVALLIAGLAICQGAAAPRTGAEPACACCAGGRCVLADRGCDHLQPPGRGQLTACCITASDRPGAATAEDPPRLEPAVLAARFDECAIQVRQPAHPTLLRSASPILGPEPPPPRPASAGEA